MSRDKLIWICLATAALASCSNPAADLVLVDGRVYTFTWDEPALDGTPAANAPHDSDGWHPDAEAVAVHSGEIVFVGSNEDAEAYVGPGTEVIDLAGATVIPGLIESHVHVVELGANLERVNVAGVDTENQVVDMIAEQAETVPKGEWITGWGWDEGAWANRYPTMELLSRRVPDHPVYLKSLHGFAVWGNRMAFELAGITAGSESPSGGEIVKDAGGNPTGILLNRATVLLEEAVPPLSIERIKTRVYAGLEELAASGYVAAHEAGADSRLMQAFEELEQESRLPIRMYAMIRDRDEALLRRWLETGPQSDRDRLLTTRCVKAFYDGALGSRGAKLLEDYSDMPGHRGVSGDEYGFNEGLVAEMIRAGFQVEIHAIGDAGNRETLDFLERMAAEVPASRSLRHKVVHAQVLHPDDVGRFAQLDVIASMQPPHAVEDAPWAEARVGPERVRYAYAWRTLRETGARLVFNSDLAGSDHDIFYGLHAAITRRNKELQPEGGWYPAQAMSPEEALRGYTVWPAYAAFQESETGVLESGKWADITVMNLDPFVVGATEPELLLEGSIVLTIVDGRIAFQR
jgi:predicted amidohydrolase YtcJ